MHRGCGIASACLNIRRLVWQMPPRSNLCNAQIECRQNLPPDQIVWAHSSTLNHSAFCPACQHLAFIASIAWITLATIVALCLLYRVELACRPVYMPNKQLEDYHASKMKIPASGRDKHSPSLQCQDWESLVAWPACARLKALIQDANACSHDQLKA